MPKGPSMLTRRGFTGLVAASLASPSLRLSAMGAHGITPQFSVMVWTLNKLGTFEQSLELVARAGYRQVELVGESKKWSEDDYSRILAHMKTLGITVDATAGMSHGFADPTGGDAYIAELNTLIPVAKRLGCKQIIFISGKRAEVPQPVQHQACIDNLKRAAPLLAAAGLTSVIEPIDRLENPPIYLDGVTEAFEIVKAVGSPNVRALYDLYHEQRSQGNLIEKLEKNIDSVGLIHIADVPGRHEPGTGEMNYDNIFRTLGRLGYKGTIAMEFYPTTDPLSTLRTAREQAIRSYAAGSTPS
jgi:hydroxypyruvate isomerase